MKKFNCLLLTLLALFSCAKVDFPQEAAGASESKIVNAPEGSCYDSAALLVRLEDPSEEAVEAIRDSCGAESISPLFPHSAGKESLEKEFGLDRWFRLRFSSGVDITQKAHLLSERECVQSVEYNVRMKTFNVGKPLPFVPLESGDPALKSIQAASFSDEYLSSQWNYSNDGRVRNGDSYVAEAYGGADINVSRAWTLCAGSPEIVVAVLDEAVQWNHPDLEANMWNNPRAGEEREGVDGVPYVGDLHGWNFVKNSADLDWTPLGSQGHGTHVAGTVAAVNNNSLGVCGVAGGSGSSDGVKIMSCQIFDGFKSAGVDAVAQAFKYAADNGACIAQCSFGYESGDFVNDASYSSLHLAEVDAIRYFIATRNCSALGGGLVIASAGNDSGAMSCYPAALKECISVTAFAVDGLPTYYTNYGPGCNISAPGGEIYTGSKMRECCEILSTLPTDPIPDYDEQTLQPTGEYLPTDYGWMQGTSMSCPHVSGVAALGLSYALKNGYSYTLDEFKSIFLSSVSGLDERIARVGSKNSIVNEGGRWYYGQMSLSPYVGQMGTGAVDTWRLYMAMDGVPSVLAVTGKSQRLDISEYFGENAENLTYTSVKVLDGGETALGLKEKPSMKYGKLSVYPTKCGCCRLMISAVAGGTDIATDESMGGMEISRTVSVISRPAASSDGGWL